MNRNSIKKFIYRIFSIFKNTILSLFILFAFYNYCQQYIYKKNNPEMFDIKYINKPNKEEMYYIFNQIVNNNQGDCDESFYNKGYSFSDISLRRCYYNLNLLPAFIKNMEKIGFTKIVSDNKNYYCLNQTQASIEESIDGNGRDYIYLNLSWSQYDVCRKINVKNISIYSK